MSHSCMMDRATAIASAKISVGRRWLGMVRVCQALAVVTVLHAAPVLGQPASVSTLPPVVPQAYGAPLGPNVSSPAYVPLMPQANMPMQSTPGFSPSDVRGNVLPPSGGNPPSVAPSANPNVLPSGPIYGVPPGYISPEYERTLAPTAAGPWGTPSGQPAIYGNGIAPMSNHPREIIAPIDVYVQERRTGRAIFGGTVNSDLGVAGKIILEERDFSFRNFAPGTRFLRGGGQHLRLEAMPGNEVQRYTLSWTQPNLFEYLPYSLSIGGFYYTRELRDWSEQRGGGRVSLGFDDKRGFSLSSELRMEDVKLFRPRILGVADLDNALGSSDVYRARFRIARDTRDSPFLSSDGGLLQLVFDQVFGEYDYSRGEITWLRHWSLDQPLDPQAGMKTLTHSWRAGLTGSQTPIFENFYAGGFSTLRGFDFRGASPRESDVEVGGEFMFLGSLEYAMPITADNMLRGVAFVDYGTVERELELNTENFRASLGLGLRLFVPAISPAPFAFDFAYPVAMADTDERRIFNFFVGATR